MKNFFCIIIIFLSILGGYAQKTDIDTIYSKNKEIILEQITERLSKLARHYSNTCKWQNKTFGIPFFIYDLTDTLNIFRKIDVQNIIFLDKHIYHIAANPTSCKVSIIMILFNDNLYFFEGLNCSKKIHKIEDVLYWIENNYEKKIGENELERIINYQKYHRSISTDPMGSRPKCEYKKPRKDRKKIKPPFQVAVHKTR